MPINRSNCNLGYNITGVYHYPNPLLHSLFYFTLKIYYISVIVRRHGIIQYDLQAPPSTWRTRNKNTNSMPSNIHHNQCLEYIYIYIYIYIHHFLIPSGSDVRGVLPDGHVITSWHAGWGGAGWVDLPCPLQSVCQRHAQTLAPRRVGPLRGRYGHHSHVAHAGAARQLPASISQPS